MRVFREMSVEGSPQQLEQFITRLTAQLTNGWTRRQELVEFHDRFAVPVAQELGLRIILTPDDVDLEVWLSPATAQALRSFSRNANKSTGSAHPMDRDRWYAFIFAAHRENARFDSSTLYRWLSEAGGWSGSMASDLSREYEQARSLLRAYDSSEHGRKH